MKITIEFDDEELVNSLREIITNKQIIREAITKAISKMGLVDELAGNFATKLSQKIDQALDSSESGQQIVDIVTEQALAAISTKMTKKAMDIAQDTGAKRLR